MTMRHTKSTGCTQITKQFIEQKKKTYEKYSMKNDKKNSNKYVSLFRIYSLYSQTENNNEFFFRYFFLAFPLKYHTLIFFNIMLIAFFF